MHYDMLDESWSETRKDQSLWCLCEPPGKILIYQDSWVSGKGWTEYVRDGWPTRDAAGELEC